MVLPVIMWRSRCSRPLEHPFYDVQVRRSRGLSPDTAIEVKLDAVARRHGHELTPASDAIADLREIAGGRRDLMAAAAGSILGGYLGEPGVSNPVDVYSAGLLILAGADPDQIVEQVDDVRAVVQASRYGTHDIQRTR